MLLFMPRPKQYSLFKQSRKNTKLWWITEQHVYGGSLNYRKVARPFDSKKLTHAVFKTRLGSSLKLTSSHQSIRKLLNDVAQTYQVRIKDLAINHDHIHILFSAGNRAIQIKFLRLFASAMGRKYKTLCKKLGIRLKGSMWAQRPFTRLVAWGKKSLSTIQKYFAKNRAEAIGFLDYQPRRHRLTQFLNRWGNTLNSA